MKKDRYSLSETEAEIMEYIWNQPGKVLAKDLMNTFNAEKGKGWKKQTVNTFLTRLVENGLLVSERSGRSYLYTPVMSREEYKLNRTENMINNLYDGSMKSFMAALIGSDRLESGDIDDLRQWLSEK